MIMIEKLLIATGNKGKYHEFCEIVKGFAREIIFAPEIASMIVEETGKTYQENAMLKAQAWAKKSGLACLADDSGLEVEELDGAPGLYSARIVPGKDADKVAWILEQLQGVTNRKARFVASLALCVPEEFTLITQGYCYGHIATAPRGYNGFGYDPIFIPDGYDRSFAELGDEIKNKISHRTNAFKKLSRIIQ